MIRIPQLILMLFIFLLTATRLYAEINYSRYILYGREDGLAAVTVDFIEEDQAGFIYFCTSKGLSIFDGNTFTNYDAQSVAGFSNNLTYILELDESRLLIGSRDNGLYLFNKQKESIEHVNLNGLIIQNITKILKDSKGRIWIGCTDGALYMLPNYLDLFDPKQAPPIRRIAYSFTSIIDIIEYDDQILVSNGSQSIISLKEDKGTVTVGVISTLSDKTYSTCFVETSRGELCVSTNKGFFFFERSVSGLVLKRTIPTVLHNAKRMTQHEDHLFIISETSLYEVSLKTGDFKEITTPVFESSAKNNQFLCLKMDSHGRLWAGSWFGGAISYRLYSSSFKQFFNQSVSDIPKSDIIWSFCMDKQNGQMYAGAFRGGLYVCDTLTTTYRSIGKSIESIRYLYTDSLTPNIYAGSWEGGLKVFNKLTTTYTRLDLPEIQYTRIFYISRRDEDELFIGSGERGLWLLRESDNRLVQVSFPEFGLDNLNVRSVIPKASGKGYWMGTYNKGLFSFELDSLNNVIDYTHYKDQLEDKGKLMQILSLYSDTNRLWLCLSNGLAYIDLSTDKQIINRISQLEGIMITQILSIGDGSYWIASYDGLYLYDKKTDLLTRYFSNQIHYELDQDLKTGRIYSSTSSGLLSFCPNELQNSTTEDKVLIRSLQIDGETITPRENPNYLNNSITYLDSLILPPHVRSVSFLLSALSFNQQKEFNLFYRLKGYDTHWNKVDMNNRIAQYSNLPAGKYELDIRLMNPDNIEGCRTLLIIKQEYWYKTTLAYGLYLLAVVMLVIYLIMYLHRRDKERYARQKELTRRKKDEEMYQQKIHFFTNISHDIKAPFTLLLSPLSDLMNQPEIPSTFRERLQSLHNNGESLMRKINKILRYNDSDNFADEVNISVCKLQMVMHDIIKPFQEYAERQGLIFQFVPNLTEREQLIKIHVDKSRLESILENLITNAIKYTQNKGHIDITYQMEDDLLKITVKDTGKGIPKDSLSHIFERYYRVSSDKDEEGAGVGLHLVKLHIDQLGGTIHVKSHIGEGSTFTVLLPVSPMLNDPLKKECEILDKDVPQNYNQIQMLIVDDNKEIRIYLEDLFSPYYQIFQAKNGAEAMKLVQKELPDIIISDYVMEEQNGIDLCRQIKENMLSSHIPFIMLSAKTDVKTRMMFWQAGVDLYEEKPFNSQLLKEKVSNLLRSRKLLKYKYQIAIPVNNELNNDNQTEEVNASGSLDRKFLEEVNAVIEIKRENSDFTVQDLASEFAMQHNQFYRKLKVLTGMSANQYIRTYRLNYAAAMLREKSYQITEVLYSVGFNNPSYFTKCFKKEFGMLPSEYAENYKKEN